jgi:hypothetical protein
VVEKKEPSLRYLSHFHHTGVLEGCLLPRDVGYFGTRTCSTTCSNMPVYSTWSSAEAKRTRPLTSFNLLLSYQTSSAPQGDAVISVEWAIAILKEAWFRDIERWSLFPSLSEIHEEIGFKETASSRNRQSLFESSKHHANGLFTASAGCGCGGYDCTGCPHTKWLCASCFCAN